MKAARRRALMVAGPIAVAVAAGMIGPATAAAGTLDDIRARGRLVVGVKTDYLHWR